MTLFQSLFDPYVVRLRVDVALLPHLRKGTFAYFSFSIFKGVLQAAWALTPLAICFVALIVLADGVFGYSSWLRWLAIPLYGLWLAGVIYLNWVFWSAGKGLRQAWQHGTNHDITGLLKQRRKELEHLT